MAWRLYRGAWGWHGDDMEGGIAVTWLWDGGWHGAYIGVHRK